MKYTKKHLENIEQENLNLNLKLSELIEKKLLRLKKKK